MRRWILLFVAGLLGLPLLLRVIELDDSFVVFVFGQTTVEMPLWFVIAAMLVATVTSYYLARLLNAIFFAPRRVSRWFDRRAQRQVRDLTLGGYLALLEGNWVAASRDLQKAAKKSGSPALNYLLAAQARVESGDLASAEALVRQAESLLPAEARVPVGIHQARLLLQAGVDEKAHDILATLAAEHPRHALLQTLLADSCERRGEHGQALQILTRLHRQKPLQDPDMITALCRLQVSHQAGAAAEETLRKQLSRQWRPVWVTLYGEAAGQDGARQLQTAEKWHKERPDDRDLLLALARISQRNALWAKARDYYEQYLQQHMDEGAARELVRLLHALGEEEKARHWQQQIDGQAGVALPLPTTAALPGKTA